MSIDVDVFARKGVSAADRDERARRAVKAFRALQPTLTAYARVLTKRPEVRVEMAATDNGSTDGKRIFFRPPIGLGDPSKHNRHLCDRRDENKQLLCPACKIREDVLVVIYHEIAHIAFDSFAQPDEADKAKLIKQAISEHPSKYAEAITKRIEDAPYWKKHDFLNMASLISNFLPIIYNALEDARVNRTLFGARKGTKVMFDANTWHIFTEGVEQKDPNGEIVVISWKEYKLNMQVIVGLFCKASGYDYTDWFVPPVVEALNDGLLTGLINQLGTVRSAAGVYHLSFPVLARLRELGYCKEETDPPEPEPDPTPEEDKKDEQEDSSSGGDSSEPSDEPGDDAPAEPGTDDDDSTHEDDGSGDGSDEDLESDDDGSGTSDDVSEPDDADTGSDSSADGSGDSASSDDVADEADGDGACSGGSDAGSSAESGSSGDLDAGDEQGSEEEESVNEGSPKGEGSESGSGGDSPDGDSDESSAGDDLPDGGAGEPGEPEDAGSSDSEGDAQAGAGDSAGADSDTTPNGAGSESSQSDESPVSNEAGGASSDLNGSDGDRVDEDSEGSPEAADNTEESSGVGGGSGADSDRGTSDLDGTSDNDRQSSEDTASSSPNLEEDHNLDDAEPGDEVRDGDGQESKGLDEADSDSSDPGRSASNDDLGGVSTPPREDSGEAIDTGADDGLGGTEIIESGNPEIDLEMGDADDAKAALLKWGEHDEKPKTIAEKAAEQAVNDALDKAIIQGLYFETPSRNVYGVREHRFGHPVITDGYNFSRAWSDRSWGGFSLEEVGADGDFHTEESILGPALLKMRVAFSENKRGSEARNMRSGKVDGRVLGKRAYHGDDRLFKKKTLPGKRDYFVLIGIDISGSTVGVNIGLIKKAAFAQANLCARMGIKFGIYAHSGNLHTTRSARSEMDLDIYLVKEPDEPWDTKVQERLLKIGPDAANLDGHTLEYYRKVLDGRLESDRIILYYTDGKMPAENHDEELEILQREIRICKQKRYTLLGVGIRTDSPARHGLETVQVDGDRDIVKVIELLKKRLLITTL